jgi:hypothetical protein
LLTFQVVHAIQLEFGAVLLSLKFYRAHCSLVLV